MIVPCNIVCLCINVCYEYADVFITIKFSKTYFEFLLNSHSSQGQSKYIKPVDNHSFQNLIDNILEYLGEKMGENDTKGTQIIYYI